MRKTSIGQEVSQEGSLREGLEAAIRERVREIMEMVLEEEVESTLGASAHQRVAERKPATGSAGRLSFSNPLKRFSNQHQV